MILFSSKKNRVMNPKDAAIRSFLFAILGSLLFTIRSGYAAPKPKVVNARRLRAGAACRFRGGQRA